MGERRREVGMRPHQVIDLERPLTRLVETARGLLGARYAALGVLDRLRVQLELFVTAGLEDDVCGTIGSHPRGRGVLGALITDPRPLRLADVRLASNHYGFPENHPPMRSFLGVPIVLAGEPCGNLYFADGQAGKFQLADEFAALAVAERAAAVIERAWEQPQR
jgi:GAF domain-containing protein